MTSDRLKRWRVASRLCAALVVVIVPTGCATSTPMCDQAASLINTGALDQATAAYAQAAHNGEGSCAGAGLDAAAKRYTDSYADVALGRSAEGAGKTADAIAAYQSALALDNANPAAKDALARLGKPAPQLLAPTPQPSHEVPGEPNISLIVFVTAAATAAICLLIGFAGWAVWWGRRGALRQKQRLEEAAVREKLNLARGRLDAALTEFADARKAFDARQQAVSGEIKVLKETRVKMLDKLDDISEAVDERVSTFGFEAAARTEDLHLLVEDLARYVGDRVGAAYPVRERFESDAVTNHHGEGSP